MSKILSQEEIDAMLSSVSSSEENFVEVGEEKKKIFLYDFKRPNLISKEQMRLLENIHESLARNFGVFLSAQLRMIVDMQLLAIDQIMYSEFVMTIAPPGAVYVGEFDNPYSQFILELSPQLSIFIVEKLFGGQGNFVSTVRPVSIIEQKIMKRVVSRIAHEISKNWKPLKEFKCTFLRFESNPEFVQIVPTSEPVIVVSMEIVVQGNKTLLNICYPYMWISNIFSTPEIQEKVIFGTTEATQDEQRLVDLQLKSAPIDLVAILGKSKISVKDFTNLNVGDVVQLNSKIDSQIPIYIKNHHFYNVSVGKSGRNYACLIQSIVEGEKDNGI